jgi:sarcosine oxidase
MGSAACFHLGKKGRHVLGIDRFIPPHTFGSTHGQTRIIREAYFEHPSYVPLVQRAYTLWDELMEELDDPKLLRQTGGVMIGPENGIVVGGALRSAKQHGLKHQLLTAAEVRKRFPGLTPPDTMSGVWEPRAGALFAEKCVQGHMRAARRFDAMLHVDETVQRLERDGSGMRVFTNKAEYRSDKVVVCAGSWLPKLVPELKLPLVIERQVQFWFAPKRETRDFHRNHSPVHLWEYEPGKFFYGLPDFHDGIKFAIHHQGEATDPDHVNREVSADEIERMRALLRRFAPEAEGTLLSASVCLYTNTPDEHFLIDWHPDNPQVLLVSPCSGHGFKFSSAIGEAVAELITDGSTKLDLSLFRNRFSR